MTSTSIPLGPEPEYEKVVSGYETLHSPEPFACEWGGVLPELHVAWESWGELSPGRDNAILLHTGLSASSHARSHPRNQHPGWWEEVVGPGLAIDTDRYFVICTNLIGGCYGSTGPSSTNPATGSPYAMDFPILTVRDMVRAQLLLLDHLGIDCLHASVGASLGGMQSLMLAALAPERVARVASISAAACSHPQSIAMRFVQRQAVMADPDWNEGRYYGKSFPHRGLRVAREMGTLTYRSGPEWMERFGRQRPRDCVPRLHEDFQVERYLAYQGDKFCLQYDPNSYLYISKAMDLFDIADEDNSSGASPEGVDLPHLKSIAAPALVIGVKSDILFPVWQQRELAHLLEDSGNRVTYVELDSPYGHDTFLIEVDRVGEALAAHLEG
ncbi:MAG: homoserine O-acetyltransferase [Myxococcota bacterium]|nr:homoserine O-acetyltransferase [Myxococcota bacterium]